MTPENFVYWLQGFFEISETLRIDGLSAKQVEVIKDHLGLVLKKETPPQKFYGTCGIAGTDS